MTDVKFAITNQAEEASSSGIRVTLPPKKGRKDTDELVWRELRPGPRGGQQSFRYTGFLEVAATDSQGSRSARAPGWPRSLYLAKASRGQGPTLARELEEPAEHEAVEVANCTEDPEGCLDILWFSAGRPLAIRRALKPGSRTDFELMQDVLLFTLGQRSPEETKLEYVIPPDTTTVLVSWDGHRSLTFEPPSDKRDQGLERSHPAEPGDEA